jgi:chemotaxis signal transduction protein
LSDAVEILTHAKRTIVPGAPEEVAGVIQIRGEIRPVFHFGRLLQHAEETKGDGPEAVLVLRAASRQFGVLVDEVEDVRSAGAESCKPAPANSAHIRWMTGDLIPVLDVATLIKEDD